MMHDATHETTRPDPLIDEVRAIRKAISDQFDNDVDKLCDHLQRREQEHKERLVRPTRNRQG
jgi:hypothetical protein